MVPQYLQHWLKSYIEVVDHCRGVFKIIPSPIQLMQPGNMESMAHLSSCLHNCYERPFPI